MSTMLSSAELESALVMGNPDTESDEDYEQDEPMMEDMVNEVARRVAKRLKGLKKSK